MLTISSEQLDANEPLAAEHDEIGLVTAETIVPHVLDGIDDDVVKDLAAVGITLDRSPATDLSDAERQAFAARLLRRACEIEDASAEINAACETEIAMIRANAKRRTDPLQREYVQIITAVQGIAGLIAWKKRKSAQTPYGALGIRHRPATVELSDADATLAWAIASRPEVVRVSASLPLSEARERFSSDELAAHAMRLEWGALKKGLDPEGELPPGIVAVPARDEPFATPEKEAM